MPAIAKDKFNVVYFHGEGGSREDSKETLVVPSANLVDFIVTVISQAREGAIYFPKVNIHKEVIIDLPSNCSKKEVPINYNGNKFERLFFIFKLPFFLLKSKNKNRLNEASHSISIGYTFFGIVPAIIRVYILKKNHTFIIRGNRPKTVATSSRPFINKKLTLARLKLYEVIMKKMLIKSQADIWFQGQEKYEEFKLSNPRNSHNRLHVLNAVLRELPRTQEMKKKSDLVFLGHINIEKGIFDLIDAIHLLKKKNLTLRIVGAGPDQKKLNELIHEYELTNHVTLAGFASSKEKVSEELTSAKLFVLPSHTEGLPRSMIESMALGTPVLVTPVGGIPYVIKNGKNGFLVEGENPKKLAQAINDILDKIEKNEISDLIEVARKEAQNYSFKKRAAYFLTTSPST